MSFNFMARWTEKASADGFTVAAAAFEKEYIRRREIVLGGEWSVGVLDRGLDHLSYAVLVRIDGEDIPLVEGISEMEIAQHVCDAHNRMLEAIPAKRAYRIDDPDGKTIKSLASATLEEAYDESRKIANKIGRKVGIYEGDLFFCLAEFGPEAKQDEKFRTQGTSS